MRLVEQVAAITVTTFVRHLHATINIPASDFFNDPRWESNNYATYIAGHEHKSYKFEVQLSINLSVKSITADS